MVYKDFDDLMISKEDFKKEIWWAKFTGLCWGLMISFFLMFTAIMMVA